MSESTSSESSSILSSPRVRKRKHFGDDFYVYDKKKKKHSSKPSSDETVQNGASELPHKDIFSPKCVTNMDSRVLCSNFIRNSISLQNGLSHPRNKKNDSKDSLHQNGFHESISSLSGDTEHENSVQDSEPIQSFSFSSASDIGDYFKKEAMQISNESNESSLQSELEVNNCSEKHVELLKHDVIGEGDVKDVKPFPKKSNFLDFGDSEEPFSKDSDLVDIEESDLLETKFEDCESPISNYDSLFMSESTIPEDLEEVKDQEFLKESHCEPIKAEVTSESKAINLETSKITSNERSELDNSSSDSVKTRLRSSGKKTNDVVIITVKKECPKDENDESANLEMNIQVDISDKANALDPNVALNCDTKKRKKLSLTVNKEPLKKRGRKPKSLSNPNKIEQTMSEPTHTDDKNNLDLIISTDEVCFSCKIETGEVIKCTVETCQKYYHSECMNNLPISKAETKACSLHTCLVCYNTNPRLAQNSKGDMYKCFKCPSAFHKNDNCTIPGAVILTSCVISCPDHFTPEKLRQYLPVVNLPFCVICGVNSDLVFCSSCPHASHPACQPMESIENGVNKCFRCVKRKILHFGDIVWAKVYDFRWWPAKILSISEIDDHVKTIVHYEGEFPVKFFGTGEIYWVQKSRVYPFVYKHVDRESLGIKHNFRKMMPFSTFDEALNLALKATNNLTVTLPKKFQSESKKYPPYKHIKSNRPIGSVQIYAADEFDNNPCNCKAEDRDPCGYDAVCLNRSMCTECAPDVCNAGDSCQNQKFQKRDYAPVKPYWTAVRGWGLQAMADIKKGHFVSEYCGDLIDEEECQRRIKEKQAVGDNNFYFCTLDANRIIDAGPKGNFSRFMNHSCEPNCVTQKWIVNGDARVGIFAKYDIPAGSELTFDYQMDFSHFKKLKCNCGSQKCSGIIGKKPHAGSKQRTDASDSDVEGSENSKDGEETVFKKRGPKKKIGNGTSKKEVTETKEKELVVLDAKNSRKKSENPIKPKTTKKSDKVTCFKCKTGGKLVHCSWSDCAKDYHIRCVKSSLGDTDKVPESWNCPRHFCVKCKDKASYLCSECPKSFCDTHVTKKNKTKEKFLCPKHA